MKEEDGEARRRLARIGVFRPDVEADLDAELEFHYREVVDSLVESGSSIEEAEAEATRRCVGISLPPGVSGVTTRGQTPELRYDNHHASISL